MWSKGETRVPFANVINIKGGCNMGAESCIAAHSALVVWVTESTDTSALTGNMQTPHYCLFTLTKTKWTGKIPDHFGLL